MTKLVVWDLFGGSQNSVYNALKYFKEFEVYTFDNNPKIEHEKQYIVDLLDINNFEKVIKENNIPKPHIIVASPLCRAFSILLNCGKDERVAITKDKATNLYVVRGEREIEEKIKNNAFLNKTKASVYRERGIEGMKLLDNTIKIIWKYNPLFWYIENPKTSFMWRVIQSNYGVWGEYYLNEAHYNSYDLSFSQKPTIFYSNLPMVLKKYGIKDNVVKPKGAKLLGSSKNETGERVKIPTLLIMDIFHNFKQTIERHKHLDKWLKENFK